MNIRRRRGHGTYAPLTRMLFEVASQDDSDSPPPPFVQSRLRTRTRNTVIPIHLTDAQIKKQLITATVNTRIKITWSSLPDPTHYEEFGNISAKTKSGFLVVYDDPNLGTLPMPPQREDVLIHELEIIGQSLFSKQIAASNRPVITSAPSIFLDGGARPSSGGPGASAILLQTPESNGTASFGARSRFFPHVTNNIAEFIAMHAALALAARLINEGHAHVNIVTDSEISYRSILGLNKITDKKLIEIADRNKLTLLAIAGKVTIAHMMRHHHNPADQHATAAILTQQAVGDQSLFTDPPILPPAAKRTPLAPQTHAVEVVTDIVSLEDFAKLRFLKTRSKAPTHAAPIFANIVAFQMRKVLAAISAEDRHEEIIKLLVLPTLYLPQRASTKRIITHITAGTPFQTTQHAEGKRTRNTNRLTEAVQRLVMDNKLRSANKLIQQTSEVLEMPFEVKCEKLQAKFITSDSPYVCTLKLENIPHISQWEVLSALGKMSKQAATAIDAWTPTLMLQVTSHVPETADMLASILTILATQPLSNKLREILLLGRLVAIPKDPDDVRPIVVSSMIINLLGLIAITRDDRAPSIAQHAIKVKQGCQRILHKIQVAKQQGKTVVKFDLKNAFGMLPRKIVQQQLDSASSTLRQFYRLVYGHPTKLVTFGPDGKHSFLSFNEGIKQGDSAASYLFCHGIDQVIARISTRTGIPLDQTFAYMDDLTYVVDATQVNSLSAIVQEEFATIGMVVNMGKSAALSANPSIIAIPRTNHGARFVTLGVDISDTANWLIQLEQKQMRYFDLLRQLEIHPHIKFVLLRICGGPRITYHCSVVDPALTLNLASNFQRRLLEEFSSTIDPSGRTIIDP